MASFWDERFGTDDYLYGTEPNEFLMHRHTLFAHRGRILLPGDGEGRNGVWLARRGFDVTSMDASEVGLAKTRRLAEQLRTKITTVHASFPDWAPEENTYDGVVLCYLHLPPSLRQRVHRSLVRGLKPGGVLLLEAFTPAQLGNSSGGPKDEALLYTADLLREDFDELDIDAVLELETVLNEGPGHQGKANVVRLIGARKRD